MLTTCLRMDAATALTRLLSLNRDQALRVK